MIKRVKQHKSCVRLQYTKEAGSSAIGTVTLPMLRASSLLITSGATLAEQKVHWMRSFEDIWKRVGTGAEALEPIALDAEWQLQMQVQVNLDKLFEILGFPAGNYVLRRSTPVDRLLVQPIPNRPLKNQYLRMLVLQLLYVQQEFSEVRFDIIEAVDAEALGDKLSRDVGSSTSYLEAKPEVLAQPAVPTEATPAQPPTADGSSAVPPEAPEPPPEPPVDNPNPSEGGWGPPPPPPARDAPDIFDANPASWKGIKRPDSDYFDSFLDRLGYTRTEDNPPTIKYGGKQPFQSIAGKQYDALGFKVDSEGNIEV